MKKILIKILLSLGIIISLQVGNPIPINATNDTGTPDTTTEFTSYGMPKQNSIYIISGRGIDAGGDNNLLQNAIKLVNRIMSMLSVVALVVLLIGGFKMITANGDDGKYKKGFTVLKQAAIGLIIIGLSWAIIRLIFRFISKTDTEADYDTNS